jgi:hypothetical protein
MEFSYFKTAPGSWNPRSFAQDSETPLDSSKHIIAQLGPDERLGIFVITGNVGSKSARCAGYIRAGPRLSYLARDGSPTEDLFSNESRTVAQIGFPQVKP